MWVVVMLRQIRITTKPTPPAYYVDSIQQHPCMKCVYVIKNDIDLKVCVHWSKVLQRKNGRECAVDR
jgi:hypothetical protein